MTAGGDNIIPLKLWGKKSDCESSVHLLEYHMVDSASICAEILKKDQRLLKTIASALGVECNVALQSVRFLTALHDIGKVSNLFQYQNQEIRSYRHDLMGYVLLTSDGFENRIVQHLIGQERGTTRRIRRSIRDLIRASTMHHGSPSGWNRHESELFLMFREQGEIADASIVIEHLSNLYPLDSYLSSEALESEEYRSVTSLIAGLISLSDWIASDESIYPWKGDAISLLEYRNDSEKIARRIIGDDVLGIFLSQMPGIMDYRGVFDFELSPIQMLMAESESGCAMMAIVEDATGSGKTEASLIWASRSMSSHNCEGMTYALPTRATSNMMFTRLESIKGTLFGNRCSTSLIHGSSKYFLESQGVSDVRGWYSEGSNKSMFANISVCTVDQAIQAILPVRYEPLKLLSLSRHVLVIDEVHSFDAYTFNLICGLVSACRLYSIPVMLLSATLPSMMRRRLLSSYNVPVRDLLDSYPLVTICDTEGYREVSCEPSHRSERVVHVRYTSDEGSMLQEILDLSKAGFRIGVIRNTVDSAIETYDALQDLADVPVILIHSRFTVADRTRIENNVMDSCGKDAHIETGLIVVGTQVIEQSMDISFDRLFSDLSPMDSVIQRMGRMQRFGARGLNPEVVIFGPPFTDNPSPDWYSDTFPKASFVYRNHYSLWKTAELLLDRDVRIPSDYRDLVERAYSSPPEGSPFHENYMKFVNESMGSESSSSNIILNLKQSYGFESEMFGKTGWDDSTIPATREDDGRTEMYMLAVEADGHLVPLSGLPETSVIRLRRDKCDESVDNPFGRRWVHVKAVVLHETSSETFKGFSNSKHILYDNTRGARYV